MQRTLRLNNRVRYSERDFQAERDALNVENEESKLKHRNNIVQIMQDAELSTAEKKEALKYEKFLILEEQSAYQNSLYEINVSEAKSMAEQYEGNVALDTYQSSENHAIANEAICDFGVGQSTNADGMDYE